MASKNRLDQAAGASIGSFFSSEDENRSDQTEQKPTEFPEPIQTVKAPTEEKNEEKANTKQKKQVFSFRATLDNIADWKAYATATGQTMENVGSAAMNEYLERHELTGAEKVIFEAMKAKRKQEDI